ncbi:cytochrome P450 [Lentithecium fluviatile CBS 122367]|uniref:Cytochrome P450 n=1 Tax=Lentithecium fluviatile CBS 122367 TaxID=1168545 RepID=A0A6G1ID58_9PLEO|nr:cytochrome P450 [Lentithecium fluviatile CBS 122367]
MEPSQSSSSIVRSLLAYCTELSAIAKVALFLALVYFLWRLTRFSVIPALHPDEPQEYPYWIPAVGHLFSFFQDSDRLLAQARIYFGNTRDPFAVTVAGRKLYVLTKATDVSEAYRNIKNLSFNVFVQEMLRTIGCTNFCVEELYRALPPDKDGFPNPQSKPLAVLARDMHIQQLYPGDYLDALGKDFDRYFDHHFNRDTILQECSYAEAGPENSLSVPLLVWCSDTLVRAGQEAYFGRLLEEIDPKYTWKFLHWDDISYQLQFQYPKWLSSKMHKGKDELVQGMLKYLDTPQEKRSGDAWFVKAIEDELNALNLTIYDISVVMVTIYWGINTNTRKAAFWLLGFILQDPELYHSLCEEIQPAFSQGSSSFTPDAHYLLEKCPRLNAAWDETVRMSAFSASVRHVLEDTVIGGKLLRKGSRLMIPYRQLHFDQSVFGAEVDSFKPDRFIKDKTLTRGGSWRPFGGGTTQCPGRYAAKQVVLSFVAMLLKRFHVELDGPQKLPEPQLGKPVLGIVASKGDLRVRITPRTP